MSVANYNVFKDIHECIEIQSLSKRGTKCSILNRCIIKYSIKKVQIAQVNPSEIYQWIILLGVREILILNILLH